MKPINANKIRKSIDLIDPLVQANEINDCVSRLAFE